VSFLSGWCDIFFLKLQRLIEDQVIRFDKSSHRQTANNLRSVTEFYRRFNPLKNLLKGTGISLSHQALRFPKFFLTRGFT